MEYEYEYEFEFEYRSFIWLSVCLQLLELIE